MLPSASTFLKFRGHVWSSKHVFGVGAKDGAAVGATVGIEGAEVIGAQHFRSHATNSGIKTRCSFAMRHGTLASGL